MTNTEHRNQVRKMLAQQPKGKLQLLVGDLVLDVRTVVDVSADGVRLQMDVPITIHSDVRVKFHSDEVLIELNGIAVWCAKFEPEASQPSNPATYIVGFKLMNPTLLHAFL